MNKIIDLLPLRKQDGEVGIEIEIEGEDLPSCRANPYWKGVGDGSLRGESIEYVLKKPVKRNKVLPALRNLKTAWFKTGSVIDPSERAGVHVHINMQEETLAVTGTFMCLYYCFESVLLRYCGESREGNHFCLRVRDAEFVLRYIEHAIETGDLGSLHTDKIRYASMNLKALPTYGSLEFRGMRSTSNLKEIYSWANMLLSLKDEAKRLGSPSAIAGMLSEEGILVALNRIFGKEAALLGGRDVEELVYEDMRSVQTLMFNPSWTGEVRKRVFPRQAEINPVQIPLINPVEIV